MGIIINGVEHHVGTAAVARSYRKEYKYKLTTEDGVEHSEVRAVYVDFVLALGNVDAAAYDGLISALLEAVGDITVTLPASQSGVKTYTGRFDGIGDEIITQDGPTNYWDNLTLTFTGTVPLEVGGV